MKQDTGDIIMALRIAQVGYGYWGANVARKLLASGKFTFVCLAEKDEGRRTAAVKQLPEEIRVLEDYKEALEMDVDAVAICTQTEYSYGIAMDAMKRGKHVFIEKPIATTVARTQELIRTARERGLILHCDHLMIYNPVIRYIKEMVDRGELGEIMYVDVQRINLGPIRKDINAMLDLAVHDIAVIDYLVDGLVPDRLNAIGASFFGQREAITYLSMKMGELLININSSWLSPVKVRRTMIAGTKKMAIFDDVKTEKLRIYESGIDVRQDSEYGSYETQTRIGDIYIPHIPWEDSLQNSLEHFAECVEMGKESLSGPEQSLRVMRILECAQTQLSRTDVPDLGRTVG